MNTKKYLIYGIRGDKNYIIPPVYQKMNERGYTNPQNDSYLWLNEMECELIDKFIKFDLFDKEFEWYIE